MRFLVLAAAAAVFAFPAAAAPSWRDFQGVSNTSSVTPQGERVLQLSITVPASSEAVWAVLSTAEGWKSWTVPFAQVDFRVGGVIETSYDPAAKAGDAGNIRNQILAYAPGRMLAIRNIKAPAGFGDAEAFGKTATVILLDPAGAAATRVTLTAPGFGPGEAFDRLYAAFEWADAYSLDELNKRFTRGPVDWAQALARDKAARTSKMVEQH